MPVAVEAAEIEEAETTVGAMTNQRFDTSKDI